MGKERVKYYSFSLVDLCEGERFIIYVHSMLRSEWSNLRSTNENVYIKTRMTAGKVESFIVDVHRRVDGEYQKKPISTFYITGAKFDRTSRLIKWISIRLSEYLASHDINPVEINNMVLSLEKLSDERNDGKFPVYKKRFLGYRALVARKLGFESPYGNANDKMLIVGTKVQTMEGIEREAKYGKRYGQGKIPGSVSEESSS